MIPAKPKKQAAPTIGWEEYERKQLPDLAPSKRGPVRGKKGEEKPKIDLSKVERP